MTYKRQLQVLRISMRITTMALASSIVLTLLVLYIQAGLHFGFGW